ncbi:MAG: hypothetical protein COB53_00515 [Elusimicrobia bacterium]|nr:MAG: hypothetical protein COB53_00515 [Elusimicrobiota bacterium]
MGATSAMYDGPWKSLPDSNPLEWPTHHGETTIADVARRMIDEHAISARDSIIGSSLGGIVALEIHRFLTLNQVILVGSAVSRAEINGLLLGLAPLAQITPLKFIQVLAGKTPTLMSSMFAEVDSDFIKAMCGAVAQWEGYTGSKERISRIHGDQDLIIACPADAHVIAGGGHLIAITHSEDCVRLIEELQ